VYKEKSTIALETISGFISQTDPTCANITIDGSLYNLEAINAACYAFTDNYHILITRKSNTSVTVIFEIKSKDSRRVICEDIKEFINAVIDHQVRLQLDLTNGKIRDLIVAHAFSPFDLHKETKSL
jgi:His-Xaa-Ser system protein HxsD